MIRRQSLSAPAPLGHDAAISTTGVHRVARAAAIGLLVTLVFGCSSSSHGASKTTTTQAGTPTTQSAALSGDDTDSPQAIFAHGWPPPGSGGTCSGATPGKAKILMTFCHGTAQIELHLPGSKLVTGGVCWINGSNLELDWGAQTAEGFTGPLPDSFTMMMPSQPGPIDGSIAMFSFNGKESQFPLIFGEIGYKLNHALPIAPSQVKQVEGDFSGGAFASSLSFQGTFNCNGTPPPFPSVAELIQRSKTAVPIPGAG
jgi:hypothetical protein